jgi:hypothetical protein
MYSSTFRLVAVLTLEASFVCHLLGQAKPSVRIVSPKNNQVVDPDLIWVTVATKDVRHALVIGGDDALGNCLPKPPLNRIGIH